MFYTDELSFKRNKCSTLLLVKQGKQANDSHWLDRSQCILNLNSISQQPAEIIIIIHNMDDVDIYHDKLYSFIGQCFYFKNCQTYIAEEESFTIKANLHQLYTARYCDWIVYALKMHKPYIHRHTIHSNHSD